jgi:hypothetical protein
VTGRGNSRKDAKTQRTKAQRHKAAEPKNDFGVCWLSRREKRYFRGAKGDSVIPAILKRAAARLAGAVAFHRRRRPAAPAW